MPGQVTINHNYAQLLNSENLRRLYIEESLSTNQIAELYQCSGSTIRRVLKRNNIPTRTNSQSLKTAYATGRLRSWKLGTGVSTSEVVKLYKEGLSQKEIASTLNVSTAAIGKHLRKAGGGRSLREAAILAWQKGKREVKGIRKRDGYIYILNNEHPRANYLDRFQRSKYVREHILIWEKVHQKPLPDGWEVHHLNGIRSDNRPENLVALPSKEHARVIPILKEKIRRLEAEIDILRGALKSQALPHISEN